MNNEQKPVFIELTKIFDSYITRGLLSFKIGTTAKEITINANSIEQMEDIDKDRSQHPSTEIIKTSGEHILVKETQAEIKQKIAAAMKP